MKLYLSRHGKTTDNEKGIWTSQMHGKLTYQGKAHAENLGRLVQLYAPRIIIASDLKRAYDTAQIAAESGGYHGEIERDPRLREVDFGDFTGKTIQEIREMCGIPNLREYDDCYMNDSDLRNRLVAEFGIESLGDLAKRRDGFLEKIANLAKQDEDSSIFAVSHSAFLAHVVEGILYKTCGKNVRLTENGGFYPQHYDQVSIIDYANDGSIENTQINIPIEELLGNR